MSLLPGGDPTGRNAGPGLVGGCSPNREGPLLKPEDKDASAGLAPCKAAVPSKIGFVQFGSRVE